MASTADASGMMQVRGTEVKGARYNEVVVLHSCAIGNECQVPGVACPSDRQAWESAIASRSSECGMPANVRLATQDSARELDCTGRSAEANGSIHMSIAQCFPHSGHCLKRACLCLVLHLRLKASCGAVTAVAFLVSAAYVTLRCHGTRGGRGGGGGLHQHHPRQQQ